MNKFCEMMVIMIKVVMVKTDAKEIQIIIMKEVQNV